jgi:hypothetical protein
VSERAREWGKGSWIWGWEPRAIVVERVVGVDGIWRRGRDDLRLLRACVVSQRQPPDDFNLRASGYLSLFVWRLLSIRG